MENQIVTEIIKPPVRLEEVVHRYSVYFVHGIHPDFSPGGNTLLNPKIDWKHKLDIVLALAPTLSASTIKKGDSWRNLWSDIGVVLSDGVIQKVYAGDGGSRAKDLHNREYSLQEEASFDEAIMRKQSKKNTFDRGYNEWIIKDPVVAGMYINIDGINEYNKRPILPYERVVLLAKERGLDLYVINDGVLYRHSNKEVDLLENLKAITTDQVTEEVIKQSGWVEIDHQEVLQKKIDLSEEKKDEIANEVINGEVFNLDKMSEKLKFIKYVGSVGSGRDCYMRLLSNKILESLPNGVITQTDIFINEILVRYVKRDNILVRECRESGLSSCSAEQIRWDKRTLNGVNLIGQHVGFTRKIYNPHDFVKEIDGLIGKYGIESSLVYQDSAFRLGCCLWGFGQQALSFGDRETYDASIDCLTKHAYVEKIEEMLKAHLHPNGKVRITVDDLRKSGKFEG